MADFQRMFFMKGYVLSFGGVVTSYHANQFYMVPSELAATLASDGIAEEEQSREQRLAADQARLAEAQKAVATAQEAVKADGEAPATN